MGKAKSHKKSKRIFPYQSQAVSATVSAQADDNFEPIPKGYVYVSPGTLKVRRAAALRAKMYKFDTEPNLLRPMPRTPLKRGVSRICGHHSLLTDKNMSFRLL